MTTTDRIEGEEMGEGLFHPFGDRLGIPVPLLMLGACADRGTPCDVLGRSGLCDRCAERDVLGEQEPAEDAVFWPAW
jgi:hypothetical protein